MSILSVQPHCQDAKVKKFLNRCAWATRTKQDVSKTLRKALVSELQEKNAEKEQLFDSHCILGAEELRKERGPVRIHTKKKIKTRILWDPSFRLLSCLS